MEYQVLARKWRPTGFADLIGQEQVARTLQNAIELGRIAHAYLFTGVRGVGKTSSARILAKALNCEKGPTPNPCNDCTSCREIAAGSYMDVLEIDGASNTGVDDVRDLKENIQYLPTKGRYKIYIIDEVHMLSKAAFNALLKTLEEPPKGVVFILATTEPHKLPDTILSRCQRYDFKRVSAETIAARLKTIAASEGVALPEGLLQAVARESQGSVRDALTLTDRLISYCGKEIDEARGRELLGLIDRTVMAQLFGHVIRGEAQGALTVFQKVYYAGYDLKRLVESLVTEVRHALLIKIGLSAPQTGISNDEATELQTLFREVTDLELERYFELLKQCLFDLGRADQEQFLVESVLIKMCHVRSDLVSVQEALRYLKGQQAAAPKPVTPPVANAPAKEAPKATAAAPLHDTIEDPYVKNTVGLFGAKVEKIHIRED